MHYFRAFPIVLLLLLGACAPNKQSAWKGPSGLDPLTAEERQLVESMGVIRYAPDPSFPPFEYVDEKNQVRGITPDILKLIATKLRIRIEFQVIPTWSEVLEAAKTGRVDLLGTLTKTAEREKFLSFTEPYLSVPYVLFVRDQSGLNISLEHAEKFRIGVVKDYGINNWLTQNYPGLRLDYVKNTQEGLTKLSVGQLDALVETHPVGSYYARELSLGNVRILPRQIHATPQYLALTQAKSQLLPIIQKGLDSITPAERAEIFVHWTGQNFMSSAYLFSPAVVNVVIVLLTLVLLSWIWIYSLRRAVANQTRELIKSESRYRYLFDTVPVVLWEEDLSGVRQILEELSAGGVADIRKHLRAHPELLLQCATRARILSVNDTGVKAYAAKSKDDLLGNLSKVLTEDSMSSFGDVIASLWEGRGEAYGEGVNRTLNGRSVWVVVRAVPAPGHEKSWSQVLVSTVDITDRKRAEEDRISLVEQLRQSQKMEAIGTLAGGVAHDFNNILVAILGYAELALLKSQADSPIRKHLDGIIQASLNAKAVVQQILAFSRRSRIEKKNIDLTRSVREGVSLVRATLSPTIVLDCQLPEMPCFVNADTTQMNQVLMNLCANAHHAMQERGKGRIDVILDEFTSQERFRCSGVEMPPGEYARLRVRDDGHGMSDEVKRRVFEPYFTTRKIGEGSGLGLSVVLGIVGNFGGGIDFKTQEGVGTEFSIFLPKVNVPFAQAGQDMQEVGAQNPAITPEQVPGGSEKILFVDDEDLVRSVAAELLESLGYKVTAQASCIEAQKLYAARSRDFDLVITDQSMPQMTGLEFTREILKINPGQRVLICTGFSEKLDTRIAQDAGAVDLIYKPIDRAKMAQIIRRTLDRTLDRRQS